MNDPEIPETIKTRARIALENRAIAMKAEQKKKEEELKQLKIATHQRYFERTVSILTLILTLANLIVLIYK